MASSSKCGNGRGTPPRGAGQRGRPPRGRNKEPSMPKPILLVTRKLPDAIEARASRDYDARLNPNDDPWSTDGAEIARRATEIGAAGVFGAAGDQFNAACINALPDSVKVIATFSVGFDH